MTKSSAAETFILPDSVDVEMKDAPKKGHLKVVNVDYLADYFSRVQNTEELFKVGKDFADSLKSGTKNFAITSLGLKNSQQRTILGLCCFFDRVDHLKIAIVSDQLTYGVFDNLVRASKDMNYDLKSISHQIKYKSYYHHFDFFDYADLMNFYDQHFYNEVFDSEMEKIFEHYDLILWDMPDIEKIKLNPHFHYRLSHFYQSLTAIITEKCSTSKLKGLRDYFNNYKLNLNRVLFDKSFNRIHQGTYKKRFMGII
jgi:hypothetical protein